MHEQEKLAEAKYHLDRMKQMLDHRIIFNFEVRAFVPSARSVVQYIRKEIDDNSKGKEWYNSYLANCRVLLTKHYLGYREEKPGGCGPHETTLLRFFRDLRNIDIHEAPIRPSARYALSTKSSVLVSTSASAVVIRRDGTQQNIPAPNPPPPAKQPEAAASALSEPTLETTAYYFTELESDPSGDDDVVTLCEQYFQELERFVETAHLRNYIGVKSK